MELRNDWSQKINWVPLLFFGGFPKVPLTFEAKYVNLYFFIYPHPKVLESVILCQIIHFRGHRFHI